MLSQAKRCINDPLLKWFESYLKGRVLYVKYKKFVSTSINVLFGVLQGSHLDPILFLIFINSVCSVFKDVEFLLVVYDLKL